ncbi:hypothetical protein SDJN03_18678, partial [Cucurbita argyrosperma subsp. sororia]
MGCSALIMMTEYSFKLAAAYEGKFEDYPEAVNWYPFERMNVFHSDPERLISFAAAGKDQSFSVPESSSVFRKYVPLHEIYGNQRFDMSCDIVLQLYYRKKVYDKEKAEGNTKTTSAYSKTGYEEDLPGYLCKLLPSEGCLDMHMDGNDIPLKTLISHIDEHLVKQRIMTMQRSLSSLFSFSSILPGRMESAPPIYDDEFAIKLWECLYLQQSGWGSKVKVKRPADRR